MKKNNSEKMEKLISKGKWSFVFWHGVIGWGVLTAILVSLIQHFTSEQSFFDGILGRLVILPIGGIFFGLFMWFIINRQYIKSKYNPTNN